MRISFYLKHGTSKEIKEEEFYEESHKKSAAKITVAS